MITQEEFKNNTKILLNITTILKNMVYRYQLEVITNYKFIPSGCYTSTKMYHNDIKSAINSWFLFFK